MKKREQKVVRIKIALDPNSIAAIQCVDVMGLGAKMVKVLAEFFGIKESEIAVAISMEFENGFTEDYRFEIDYKISPFSTTTQSQHKKLMECVKKTYYEFVKKGGPNIFITSFICRPCFPWAFESQKLKHEMGTRVS